MKGIVDPDDWRASAVGLIRSKSTGRSQGVEWQFRLRLSVLAAQPSTAPAAMSLDGCLMSDVSPTQPRLAQHHQAGRSKG
ncbi:MAG: hypothetical protein ACREDP_17055, partial [Bradyrhizobium sp.]